MRNYSLSMDTEMKADLQTDDPPPSLKSQLSFEERVKRVGRDGTALLDFKVNRLAVEAKGDEDLPKIGDKPETFSMKVSRDGRVGDLAGSPSALFGLDPRALIVGGFPQSPVHVGTEWTNEGNVQGYGKLSFSNTVVGIKASGGSTLAMIHTKIANGDWISTMIHTALKASGLDKQVTMSATGEDGFDATFNVTGGYVETASGRIAAKMNASGQDPDTGAPKTIGLTVNITFMTRLVK
jgi:hypothetical protein